VEDKTEGQTKNGGLRPAESLSCYFFFAVFFFTAFFAPHFLPHAIVITPLPASGFSY
jgi:hypothetical protein